jgi:hypothetical protein
MAPPPSNRIFYAFKTLRAAPRNSTKFEPFRIVLMQILAAALPKPLKSTSQRGALPHVPEGRGAYLAG